MYQGTAEVALLIRGDVYEVEGGVVCRIADSDDGDRTRAATASQKTPDVAFRAVHHNTTFVAYSSGVGHIQRLSEKTMADGFYLILTGSSADSTGLETEAEDAVEGIFIPRSERDRKAVAEALRRRFGPRTVLVKAPNCECGRLMNHLGGGIYLCPACRTSTRA
jgi:hypothetical protein